MQRSEMPEMKDKFFAVIDTNVIVSALISKIMRKDGTICEPFLLVQKSSRNSDFLRLE